MKKFEGNINGKIYTDKKEFDKALSTLEKTEDMYVSYKYVSVPDLEEFSKSLESKVKNKTAIESNKNYVSESRYVKAINDKKDVKLDDELVNVLKCASNKSDIKRNVCKKIVDFGNKIDDNKLHINELKSDYKILEDKMKLINDQIRALDDENNNYYLNKEYYTNIKNLLDTPVYIPESKNICDCGDYVCKCDKKSDDIFSLKDVYDMSPYELARYLNKRKIFTLSDLVEYFLKKY